MTETGYNGWKNYETWVIALWLDNDYSTYSLMREMAIETITTALQSQGANSQLLGDLSEARRKASYQLAQQIKEYVDEQNPLAETASVYSDLLGSAIQSADFTEIAEHYLEEDLVDSAIQQWEFDPYDSEE